MLVVAVVIAAASAAFSGTTRLVVLAISVLASDVVGARSSLRPLRRMLGTRGLVDAQSLRSLTIATAWAASILIGGRLLVAGMPDRFSFALLSLASVAAVSGFAYLTMPETVRNVVRAIPLAPLSMLGTAGGALAFGAAASMLGVRSVAAAGGIALVAAAAWRPAIATITYAATVFFVAGIERGAVVPMLRVNEALLVLLLAGACAGVLVRYAAGARLTIRRHPMDRALLLFGGCAVVWPLLWIVFRGRTPAVRDLAAVLPVLKLLAIVVLVRHTIVTVRTRQILVLTLLWTSGILAVIAVAQTRGFGPVLSLLSHIGEPDGGTEAAERAATTLASSIATGDVLVIALVMLAACSIRNLIPRPHTIVLAPTLLAGILSAGQFSSWITALVAIGVLVATDRRLVAPLVRYLPVTIVLASLGLPAFVSRVSEFGGEFGVPRSWLGRYDNLTEFYLPRLGNFRFLLGVEPESVLAAPETWRDQIFLESGYLWFLWVGGVPLLLAFVWLARTTVRHCLEARRSDTLLGAMSATLLSTMAMLVVVSVIDNHLTLRGAGDVLFVLIGMVTVR